MPRQFLLDGSHSIRLADFDPDTTGDFAKDTARERTEALGEQLSELLDLLYYAGEHALLLLLQGRDTSGKDGTIRRILQYSNAQSCRVEPFQVPSKEELAHDFLWRIHARTPARGHIAIFNRSHYEDVLVARVHGLVPEAVWRRRYAHIRHFEELLHDSGTIIRKFYLHISKDEQEERLRKREQEPEKAWKLSVGDWKEREHWDDYTAAYEDVLNETSRSHAPWIVVPADHKWYRDLVVMQEIVETLEPYRQKWLDRLDEIGREAMAEIRAYRDGEGRAGKG